MSAPVERSGATVAAPVSLFYSYAHEDESLRDELQDHLMILERRGVIRSWHDRAILPGSDWDHDIDDRLRDADLILLLISKDFIASDYIMSAELGVAMQRHRDGEAVVVPVMLRPVDLQPEDAADMPFVALQGLPRDWTPVTSWPSRDEAWTNVASGLRATVKEIRARRPTSTPAPAPAGAVGAGHDMPPEDARLAGVVSGFTERIVEANTAKGGPAVDEAEVRTQAQLLIDDPAAKRVLWVDDHPENNGGEMSCLARLQIEVATARSTKAALAQLAYADEADAFDLVVSDWTRDADGPLAGLRLLTAMRRTGYGQPVVFYHGTFGSTKRTALRASAHAAGAFGEAVLPTELMRLLIAALHA